MYLLFLLLVPSPLPIICFQLIVPGLIFELAAWFLFWVNQQKTMDILSKGSYTPFHFKKVNFVTHFRDSYWQKSVLFICSKPSSNIVPGTIALPLLFRCTITHEGAALAPTLASVGHGNIFKQTSQSEAMLPECYLQDWSLDASPCQVQGSNGGLGVCMPWSPADRLRIWLATVENKTLDQVDLQLEQPGLFQRVDVPIISHSPVIMKNCSWKGRPGRIWCICSSMQGARSEWSLMTEGRACLNVSPMVPFPLPWPLCPLQIALSLMCFSWLNSFYSSYRIKCFLRVQDQEYQEILMHFILDHAKIAFWKQSAWKSCMGFTLSFATE